jgi:hypothetical protein
MVHGSRWRVGPAVALVLLLAGCVLPLRTGLFVPVRVGPAPSWSVPLSPNWSQPSVVIGEVAVVAGDRALLGMSRSDGRQLWRRDLAVDYEYEVAGDLVVLREGKNGPVEALDPANGVVQWRAEPGAEVYHSAVYNGRCAHNDGDCTIAARDLRSGSLLWTIPSERVGGVTDHAIGGRSPYAPAGGPWLAATVGARPRPYAAVNAATGQVLAGRVTAAGWYTLAVGTLLVQTDHDPPNGDNRCTVSLVAIDGDTGRRAWAGVAGGGHQSMGWGAARSAGMTACGATRKPSRSAGDRLLLNVPM